MAELMVALMAATAKLAGLTVGLLFVGMPVGTLLGGVIISRWLTIFKARSPLFELTRALAPFFLLLIEGIYGFILTPPDCNSDPFCANNFWLMHKMILFLITWGVCHLYSTLTPALDRHFRELRYGLHINMDSVREDAVLFTNRSRPVFVFPDKERRKGASDFEKIKKEHELRVLPKDDEASKRVHDITEKIVEAAKSIMPQTRVFLEEWEVIVIIDDDRINASCLPGGKMVVYTGLLNTFKEDAEVATVLSHEVSHAVARHAMERLTRNFVGRGILSVSEKFRAVHMMPGRAVESVLGFLHKFFVMLPLERRLEIEADHIGLSLLAAAGYDPGVAYSVIKKLGELLGDPIWRFESTHPSYSERARLIMRRCKEMKDSSQSQPDPDIPSRNPRLTPAAIAEMPVVNVAMQVAILLLQLMSRCVAGLTVPLVRGSLDELIKRTLEAVLFCLLVIEGIFGVLIPPSCSSVPFCAKYVWLIHKAIIILIACTFYRLRPFVHQYFHRLHFATNSGEQDAVPFTNRTRFVISFSEEDLRNGASTFKKKREELGAQILSEDVEESKRVRGITTKIVKAAERIMPQAPDFLKVREVIVIKDDQQIKDGEEIIDDEEIKDDEETHDFHKGWEVIVIEDDEVVNAWSLPGCKIGVYTGVLKNFKDDAELAFFLSHVISSAIPPVAAVDRTRSFLLLGISRLYKRFPRFMTMPRAPAFVIHTLHEYCFRLPLSRRSETETDYNALLLLAAAGYDPRVAPSVWKKLGDISGDSEWSNYISSQPSFKKRAHFLSQDHVMEEALKLYNGRGVETTLLKFEMLDKNCFMLSDSYVCA